MKTPLSSAHANTRLAWAFHLVKFSLCACCVGASLSPVVHAALPIEHQRVEDRFDLYWVQSTALPMVDVQIDFDAGSRLDPAHKAGLAAATASMMSRGTKGDGAHKALDENELGQAWAELGSGLAIQASQDRLSVQLRSLVKPELLAKVVSLAAQELALPRFDAKIWQRERASMISSIKESNTQPAPVAAKQFQSHVFAHHPYGAMADEASLSRIEVSDVLAFHRRFLNLCHAKVSVVGDLSALQVEQVAKGLLSLLPQPKDCSDAKANAWPPLGKVEPLAQAQSIHVPFQSAQAHVLMGQPSVARSDGRYFPLLVGNYILGGGGFVSRLTDQVREKRGLSYSVYSYFAPQWLGGAFTLGLQTRADQAQGAMQLAHRVVEEFVKDGPTESELQAAKDNLVGGFALRIDSNKKLLDNVANIAWYDLPLDYLQTWSDQVQAVRVQDIRQAFESVLDPQRWVTVLVGGKP